MCWVCFSGEAVSTVTDVGEWERAADAAWWWSVVRASPRACRFTVLHHRRSFILLGWSSTTSCCRHRRQQRNRRPGLLCLTLSLISTTGGGAEGEIAPPLFYMPQMHFNTKFRLTSLFFCPEPCSGGLQRPFRGRDAPLRGVPHPRQFPGLLSSGTRSVSKRLIPLSGLIPSI